MQGIPTPGLQFMGLSRTKSVSLGGASYGYAAWSTDAIGTHTLTLTNVAVGSRVTIRDQSNTTELYNALAASSTVPITLQVYAGGSSLNNWSIRIRKSSAAPKYLPYETLMTATVGSSSIYVSQIPDTITS